MISSRGRRTAFLAAATILAATALAVAQTKIPPAPARWATDAAGFLSPRTVADLNARLEAFERQTGHQVLVYVGRTLGPGAVIEDWAVKAFEAWKVGRRGLDDGLVLFIMAEDRKVKIEVGYGLEDKVPDIRAFRVIEDILVPGFRAGRQDEAVESAVTALLGYISGGQAPAGEEEGRPPGGPKGKPSVVNLIFGGLALLVFLFILVTNPSLALWLLFSILSGGRGGGGFGGRGGGGGFRGGGGRSGGGGASGSW